LICPNPPAAVALIPTELPEQTTVLPEVVNVTALATVIVTVYGPEVHPFTSTTFTVYVVVVAGVAETVLLFGSALLQLYVYGAVPPAGVTDNVVLEPGQIVSEDEIVEAKVVLAFT
jgi:hypothetical protein